jgi:hypothetical protein
MAHKIHVVLQQRPGLWNKIPFGFSMCLESRVVFVLSPVSYEPR